MKKSTIAIKHLSVILSLAVILSSFSVLSFISASAAETNSINGMISYRQDLYDAYPELDEKIANALYNTEASIDVSEYGLDNNTIGDIYFAVIFRHPDLFYGDSNISMSGRYDSNGTFIVSKILPQYQYDSATCIEMRNEFEYVAEKYLALVDENMTDFEKAVILHDEIVLRTYYDIDCEIYDTMVNGKGKCYGYSEVYSYLLARVGVKSEIVTSDPMNHQWNKVCIDGVYYNVDVTWDDPVYDKPGAVRHNFFLVSDEKFQNAQAMGADAHTDYESYFSTGNKYDNAYYRNTISQMCFYDGKFYFIDNGPSNTYYKWIVKYDEFTDSVEPVKYLGYNWSASNGVWVGIFSSLAENDSYFYYNSSDTVYTYNTYTDEIIAFSPEKAYSGNCYGLRIIDGKVYAVLADNPKVTGTLAYIGDVLTQPYRWGDVDNDGVFCISDGTTIQRHVAEVELLTGAKLKFADYNKDGGVDIQDVTDLQKALAEIE